MSGQRVLVTGATGFVGRHLVQALLDGGCQVRAVARDQHKALRMPWFDRVEFVAADVHALDLDVVALAQGVDVLAHLAWPGLPAYQGLFHFERNLFADYTFIKSAVQAGITQIMVTGTCFEYGLQNGELSENTEARPVNPYGLAKHTLRLFLEALQREQSFTLQWVRLFYLYGEGQNPNSLLASLERAIDTGAESFDMSAGDQLRDYLPIEQAAAHMAAVVQKADFNGILNCCSGRPVSVRALVEAQVARRHADIHINLGHYPYSVHEPLAFWGDVRRLQQLLGAEHAQ
ncbi:NAD(P)-dependent oxidoreductase [Pseudomonas sp. LJDD11]|uniref:NAD-dependent epimerase/dehydratase family protein n=1 Tax=unclassified Pseudomonas TaxID=196821 RepID=UPI0004F8996D|nr:MULTISPECIES: NAD(P)-dependent oxidoreductase [unclassified Pseudomonas]MCQ9424906.1 NAD(P)-dependent oxidoreductase [Pseudomonas sp. LJDD11]BAP44162.1 UDP-glucose 4-epimerase [Pseudomonas sp. StFLB209]